MSAANTLFLITFVVLILLVLWWVMRRRQRQQSEQLDVEWEKLSGSESPRYSSSNFEWLWLALVPALLLVILLISSSVLAAFVLLLIYYAIVVLIFIIFDTYRRRQYHRFNEQLPNAIELLKEKLNAGHSLVSAIKAAGEKMRAPVNGVFTEISHQVELGKPFSLVIDDAIKRYRNSHFILLGLVLKMHDKTGANIVPYLDNVIEVIEKHQEMYLKVTSVTEQGRISAIIVAIIPFIALWFISQAKPEFLQPVFSASGGRVVFVVCGFMLVAGIYVIYKITNIRF